MIAKIISKSDSRTESINNMIHYLSELEIEGINTNKSFLISVLKNQNFENADYNTKFIEDNLSLFTKEIETLKKNDGNTQKKEKVVQKYTDNDVEAFKKIAAQAPKAKSSENYTEKDFKAFKNILNKKNDTNKKPSINNITGRVYDEPIIKPGGDKYMVIEFGNLMDLEINFTAQNLAKAILDNKIKGIYETAPCFASMLIHYNPEEIKFNDLKNEMKLLINSLGPTDDIEINSRIFSFPTVYLDKWTKECIEDYSSKIAEKTPDPDFIVELNKLENTDQFVRVHSGTEYWVSALGFWPGLPFMMPLDPRCKLTAPKYNPPRTWTPKGAVGMGGSSTAIYPDRLPGGYQIFGIIPVPIWDTHKSFSVFEESICLFKPGDRVKFIPTSYEEFDHVSNKVKDKSYDYNIIDYQKFSVKNYKNWLKTIDKTKRF